MHIHDYTMVINLIKSLQVDNCVHVYDSTQFVALLCCERLHALHSCITRTWRYATR
jgi:hypothetical protein